MGMSLEVFAPSLVKHINDMTHMSEKHAEKILFEKTGSYIFPSLPTITPSL